jgi:hypothetical protein
MKIIIDEVDIKKFNLTLEEFLYMILIYRNTNIKEVKDSLVQRNLIEDTLEGESLTEKGIRKLTNFSGKPPDKLDYTKIAKQLREVYPKGLKSGTNCMWRDSVAIIASKLKTLVEKYGCTFTEEEAINATKSYVESFNGDYTYMQVLKYFLLKTKTLNGDREVTSEFMSRLENESSTTLSNNWNDELI